MTRVAVLGAGFQGACVALELATRGIDVDLYDRCDRPITQAGARNEGKIHLGFVYANEPSLDTTRLLVRGALAFDRSLRRWLGTSGLPFNLSTRHSYGVHRDSMLPAAAVVRHFARVRDEIRHHARAGDTYLGQDASTVGFDVCESVDGYAPEAVVAVIQTDERAVDVRALAERLRDRMACEPRINFLGAAEVDGASQDGDAVEIVVTDADGRSRRRYQHVVNCLWDGKLAIDQDMQFLPDHRPIYRMKHSLFVRLLEPRPDIRSTTFVVGEFGDVVNFDGFSLYLSWYPVARTARSCDLFPPAWPRELSSEDSQGMLTATLEAFGTLLPGLRSLNRSHMCSVDTAGAVIVAAGRTDIDDPASQLHTRSAVGVRSRGGYHSVDPGKYTLAPYFAVDVANRVAAESV